jgi:hypothetical protein
MAQEIEQRLTRWLKKLNDELDRRRALIARLDRYHAGYPDPPEHVRAIKLETEYRVLLRQAVTNWPELIVDTRLDRLEVTGFDFGDKRTNDEVWGTWQRNALDADAGLVHEAALVNGRSYVIVWADDEGEPEFVPEHASTTVVAYEVGRGRRRRAAALRRWHDDDRWHCTVYLPDGLYKFEAKDTGSQVPDAGDGWVPREEPTEPWPLPNPLGVVPVVEFAVNRTLSPLRCSANQLGKPWRQAPIFGSGAGEYERVLPIIDRINTTIFAGLLAQAYASFPVRALIGDPIKYDDVTDEDGNKIGETPRAPFQAAVNRLVQIENPDGKLVQLPESDLGNYIKFAEMNIRHLAAITHTPAHYLLGEMVNLSADAIRAAEASLIALVKGTLQRDLGDPWEEVQRLGLLVQGKDREAKNTSAETQWKDAESRSMAERADAASKLKDLIPDAALWEMVLQATPQQIARWQGQAAVRPLLEMVSQVNGNGAPTGVGAG